MARATPQRESMCWVLRLEAFVFLAGGNLRGGLRGGFQQHTHQFFRCVLSGAWSPLIGQLQDWGSLFIAVVPGITHLVLLPFWALRWNTHETQMLSPGRKGQGKRGYPGGEVLVFPVLPPARHGAFRPGDHLSAAGCRLLGHCAYWAVCLSFPTPPAKEIS